MNLTDINTVKQLCKTFGFNFSKSLGQNFLIDNDIPKNIAALSDCGDKGVIEIGAGFGTLTVELSKLAKKVVAIEIDKSLSNVLKFTLKDCENVNIIYNDVLKTDIKEIIRTHFEGMDVVIAANLPYYITTPIIMYLLEQKINVKSITVMVQKEVAKRLIATEKDKDYGAISLSISYYSKVNMLFDVEPISFYPPPKVTSSVIKLDILKAPPVLVENEEFLFSLIKIAFMQRRKTFVNAVYNGFSGKYSKETLTEALKSINKDETVRPEKLSLTDFSKMANLLN